jgi:hypothetical protein
MDKNGIPELLKNFMRLPEKKQAEIFGMLKALTFIQMGETSDAMEFISKIDKSQVRGQGSRTAGKLPGTADSITPNSIN